MASPTTAAAVAPAATYLQTAKLMAANTAGKIGAAASSAKSSLGVLLGKVTSAASHFFTVTAPQWCGQGSAWVAALPLGVKVLVGATLVLALAHIAYQKYNGNPIFSCSYCASAK